MKNLKSFDAVNVNESEKDAADCLKDIDKEFQTMLGMLKAGGCPAEVIYPLQDAYKEFQKKAIDILK